MLGLEMSDGALGVSIAGGNPYPPQPLVITPHGHASLGSTTCEDTLGSHGNGYYGSDECISDVIPSIEHNGDSLSTEDQMCQMGNGLDAFHQDPLQGLTPPKREDEPGLCAACGERILDRYYLLAVDRQWHLACLTCTECKLPLDSEATCFAKDGNIYCKEDYYRMFGLKRCARCQLVIATDELVMRARDFVYHMNCFTCASCGKILTTGEQFGMQDTMIYCRIHYEMLLQHGEFSFPAGNGPMGFMDNATPTLGHTTFYNGVGAAQKGRPRKRKSPALPDLDFQSHYHGLGLDGELGHLGPDGLQLQSARQKRIRTSFKHHQLRIMKSYFALNHNPDAKDLKQLAQKTGLNKRVLQVWFQNARAKYRRNVLKQDPDKATSGSLDGSQSAGEDGKPTRSSGSGMSDLSGARSPALSDISSSVSLSDYNSAGALSLDDSDPHLLSGAHASSSTSSASSSGLASELFGDNNGARIN